MSSNIEEYIQNPIKRHIIGNLMKHKKLKYSELMPEDTDNVLFNYHLQHLVKTGLLIKEDNFYTFSPEGWTTTSHITYEGLYFPKFVCRFRIYVLDGNKVLLHKRNISPWSGDTTAPWGKMIFGEPMEQTAEKQLKEDCGLTAKMKCIGTIRTIIRTPTKDILDDSIYFICVATKFEGKLNESDLNGNKLEWYEIDKAITFEKNNKGSGDKTVEVLKRLKDNDLSSFAFEETLIDDSL